MYTKAALISALVGLAAAAPVPSATFETTGPVRDPNTFAIIASHSLSLVHGAGVSADGGNFYLNKGTATYCPLHSTNRLL